LPVFLMKREAAEMQLFLFAWKSVKIFHPQKGNGRYLSNKDK